MRLTVSAFGETIIDRELMRFRDNLVMPLAAWEVVGTILRAASERQFDTEGGYASGGWPALTDARVEVKAREGLRPEILQATGALKASLTEKFNAEHIEVPSVDSLVFGSRVPYGIYHASTAPRTIMPYRPPVALTETDKMLLVKELQRALLGLPSLLTGAG
jgi:phage gpG-like protein